ncbi:MAG: DUF4830 domain-containing protein [Clostridia bacterium]
MFIYTTKISKKKVILAVLAMALFIMLVILLRPTDDAYTVLAQQHEEAIMASITVGSIKTNEERRIFLSESGYEVSQNEISVKNVQIPQEFDEVYTKYNELQKSQGFDLSKFKGKAVELYTYQIYNYDSEDDVFANLLIYNNKIIGGDIQSASLDGFITGFEKNN